MATFVVTLVDDNVTRGSASMESAIGDLHNSMGNLSDGTGEMSDGMGEMDEALVGGEAAAAAAAAAFAALAAAAIYAGASLSVSAGETKEAFLATASAMTGTAEGGQAVLDMIDQLSMKLPLTKDKLEQLSKSFMSAGIRSVPQLQKALEATAASAALMGDDGGAFSNLISKANLLGEAGKGVKNLGKALQGTGLDVNDVAKEFNLTGKQLDAALKSGKITSTQLGDALQDAMIKKGANAIDVANQKLSSMEDKAKEVIVGMFDGVADTPGYKDFIASLQQVGLVLGMNAGKGKSAITSMFSAIFEIASKVITWMLIGLLKLGTYGLKAYVWLFPFLKKLKEWWQQHAMTEKFITALKVIGAILGAVIVAAVVAVGTAFLALNAAIYLVVQAGLLLWKGIIGIGTAIYKVASAIWDMIKGAAKALESWVSSAADFAARFIAGLTGGLAEGSDAVKGASLKVADAAKAGVQEGLGIHSPSVVAYEFGKDGFGAGLSGGMLDAANDVEAASTKMSGAAEAGLVAPSSSSSSSSKSLIVNVEAGAIVIQGAGGDIMQLTPEALKKLLELVALSQGYSEVA